MPEAIDHPWKLSPTEAIQLQRELRERIILQPLPGPIRRIAGADISFNLYSDVFYAAIVVLDYESLEVVDTAYYTETVSFPYIPGLLSFREIPTLLRAWEQLKEKPNVTMVDGHGIAHPRRMGIATHFGLATGSPTLGCAKKILTGSYPTLGPESGATSLIQDRGEAVGYALRSKPRTNPLFISPGHLLDLDGALDIARHCLGRYKLPEPTRLAHQMVNTFRKEQQGES
ncbi:deoxyribonuclease V [Lewinella marina]|uniref:Endonuclease V n=1 Tax=Neolewinella marina TaxID=438751 RepID=A0A2G0CJG5_9BACT|nr:deoxyribonuclease V [Neolewinella marina]NJB84727.1 deoxyribonuclease V [Neolewinella marina]PHL00113.1 deoxyribonuclease V [Neolewinella marina]